MGGSPAPFSEQFPGRSHRWMATRPRRLGRQDPAYRSTHRHLLTVAKSWTIDHGLEELQILSSSSSCNGSRICSSFA